MFLQLFWVMYIQNPLICEERNVCWSQALQRLHDGQCNAVLSCIAAACTNQLLQPFFLIALIPAWMINTCLPRLLPWGAETFTKVALCGLEREFVSATRAVPWDCNLLNNAGL